MNTFHFKNTNQKIISDGAPNSIDSIVRVDQLHGNIVSVRVKLNIIHSYTSDLRISLQSPLGDQVILATGVGGDGDHFEDTLFEDDASTSITNGTAPFRGNFQSVEPLQVFADKDPIGDWTLRIQDQAFQDGGALVEWALILETDDTDALPLIFNNMTPVVISSGPANEVNSSIIIEGKDGLTVDGIAVTLDLTHSYTSDLDIILSHESGTSVVLVSSQGGSGDHFRQTTFDDTASGSINNGAAPFTGAFIPEQALAAFHGSSLNGVWTLTIKDKANLDGGQLNFWKLCIVTKGATPVADTPFQIQVRFIGGLTASQRSIFSEAAARWSEAIVGNLPSFTVDGEVIDDLLIEAEGKIIDGPGQVLGQARPTRFRPDTFIPIKGEMSFDSADIQQMEDDGELLDVIIHEMGHVLGLGTLWSHLGLIEGSGTSNPEYIGLAAMGEYGKLTGFNVPTKVPLANTGGAGTREGHWREATFETELMTGYDDPGRNAMSRLTIASLQDMGYEVNLEAADFYTLPLRAIRTSELEAKKAHNCNFMIPDIVVIKKEDRVS